MKGKMRFSLKTGQYFSGQFTIYNKKKKSYTESHVTESHILELLASKIYIYIDRGSYKIYCLTD